MQSIPPPFTFITNEFQDRVRDTRLHHDYCGYYKAVVFRIQVFGFLFYVNMIY